MNWLKRILSGRKSSKSGDDQGQIIRLDDESYHANSDILEGMQFSATLQLRTPLWILKHHGERFDGPPSQAPQYGSQADGIWIFKTKTFPEHGIATNKPEFTHASDAGPIEPSKYLPFLMAFRKIVESDSTLEEQLEQLTLLPEHSAQFKCIWLKLSANYEDFPNSFFYLPFASLPRVGRKLAKRLYEAGFRTIDDIVDADVSRLTKVPGMSNAAAAKIKAARFSHGGHEV